MQHKISFGLVIFRLGFASTYYCNIHPFNCDRLIDFLDFLQEGCNMLQLFSWCCAIPGCSSNSPSRRDEGAMLGREAGGDSVSQARCSDGYLSSGEGLQSGLVMTLVSESNRTQLCGQQEWWKEDKEADDRLADQEVDLGQAPLRNLSLSAIR